MSNARRCSLDWAYYALAMSKQVHDVNESLRWLMLAASIGAAMEAQ